MRCINRTVSYSQPATINITWRREPQVLTQQARKIKAKLGKHSVSVFEFGIEVSDHWIFSQWLNKGTTNSHITRAIQYIHDAGFQAIEDLIIGIPGLTERQSIQLFKDIFINSYTAMMYFWRRVLHRENTLVCPGCLR